MDSAFPGLRSSGFSITSPATPKYNCIAWAAGDQDRWWWPDSMNVYYWPPSVTRIASLAAFEQVYALLGYAQCDGPQLEEGFEKIAIYALGGAPKHAARQLPTGKWTSKLGPGIDIEHTVDGLRGPTYGEPVRFMKRRREPQ